MPCVKRSSYTAIPDKIKTEHYLAGLDKLCDILKSYVVKYNKSPQIVLSHITWMAISYYADMVWDTTLKTNNEPRWLRANFIDTLLKSFETNDCVTFDSGCPEGVMIIFRNMNMNMDVTRFLRDEEDAILQHSVQSDTARTGVQSTIYGHVNFDNEL